MTFGTMLQALEGRVPILERRGDLNIAVEGITDDSRAVSKGSLFVAVKGERVDWDVKSASSKRIMNDPFGEFVAGCNKLDPSRVERKIIEKKINWFLRKSMM